MIPWASVAQAAASGIEGGINAITSVNDLIQDAGTSYGNVNGISYQSQNVIDYDDMKKQYK